MDTDQQHRIVMFELSGEAYGIGLDLVQEVIRLSGIVRVPHTPAFLEGVIRLRGCVIPVVDLARRFGVGVVSPARAARIMIVETPDHLVGIAVDRVLEVVSVPWDSVEPPTTLLRENIQSDYLIGFAEVNDELIKLLDFDKIFSPHEFGALHAVDAAGAALPDAPDGGEVDS